MPFVQGWGNLVLAANTGDIEILQESADLLKRISEDDLKKLITHAILASQLCVLRFCAEKLNKTRVFFQDNNSSFACTAAHSGRTEILVFLMTHYRCDEDNAIVLDAAKQGDHPDVLAYMATLTK